MNDVLEVIKLKHRARIIEDDATLEKQKVWYGWAIPNGHCVIIKDKDGNIQGFMDWVRVKDFPKSAKEFSVDFDHIKTAEIGFVTHIYAKSSEVLRKLKNIALEQNPDVKYLTWHSKKRGKMFKTRRIHEKSLES